MDRDNEIVEFGEEPAGSADSNLVVSKVSERDIFKLAKLILLVCAIVYLLIASLKIYLNDAKGINEVWEYSKVFLNSIISLVLGLFWPEKRKIVSICSDSFRRKYNRSRRPASIQVFRHPSSTFRI